MNLCTHYKNEEQLSYAKSLCKGPLVFHHEAEESYPEIEIQIKRVLKPSFVKEVLEPVLRNAGYNSDMVDLEPYDIGGRGCNELVLLLDFNLFNNEQIAELIFIVQNTVEPYASLTDVKC
ncbi:hypothetical protein [Bacillus cereus group sp. TH152-1LC]|uniref:hypothetical protein n=1 Tax=Bacillus cereus group sp. TH152-1LC TaxID=3018060 RepID=UPI0022E962DA|nr:hypothetical protein [Bacillus cereus group sp. TH152-1LC]MDA1675567.1 hypothetical protein [Bacillus cereus group sp. TH152-1LC]